MLALQDLDSFLKPRSIAIIGASTDVDSINGRPLKYLLEKRYPGSVYPVNPKYESILGVKCYPDILSVPEVPDLALIAVNARVAIRVLRDCKQRGVKNCIVFSSGFAEAGNEEMQLELDKIAGTPGMRICGPNCQGMINLFDSVFGTFSAAAGPEHLRLGPAAFVSQSGALGFSTFNMAQERGVGFGYVVTTGNQVDVEVAEVAHHILQDDRVSVAICYVEGVKNIENLRALARASRQGGKPLCVLKVGKSTAGRKAAMSHTAALTGSAEVFDAFARQENVVLLDDIEEVIDAAAAFGPGKLASGRGIGIITSSGGAGILMADRCEERGLVVPELPPETQDLIRKYIPAFGSARNPVDLTAQVVNEATQFRICLDALLERPELDVIIVVMTMIIGQSGDQVAADVIDASAKTSKPIVVCWTIGPETGPMVGRLARAGVPVFTSPAACARTVARLVSYSERKRVLDSREERKSRARTAVQRAQASPSQAAAAPQTAAVSQANALSPATGDPVPQAQSLLAAGQPLTEYQAKSLLRAYGIPTTREEVATSADEAVSIAREIGFPVAMKISSQDILHKTEAGAIRLRLSDERQVKQAFKEVMENSRRHAPSARLDGVLVQEMVVGGTEVIVGANSDPQFGPVVMYGLGGIFVEVLKDVSLRVAPVELDEALDMIKETRAYPVLLGARGRPRADIEALAQAIVDVSRFADAYAGVLRELDINPLVVLPEGKGVKVVDALMVPKQPQ
ncbi:MAG: acetate--CoA ligase family protein [Bacillota bacterium]|nr:acetate--CoA ligase family protein [Bacillota bacterium]